MAGWADRVEGAAEMTDAMILGLAFAVAYASLVTLAQWRAERKARKIYMDAYQREHAHRQAELEAYRLDEKLREGDGLYHAVEMLAVARPRKPRRSWAAWFAKRARKPIVFRSATCKTRTFKVYPDD
jgi:hypothetical protein